MTTNDWNIADLKGEMALGKHPRVICRPRAGEYVKGLLGPGAAVYESTHVPFGALIVDFPDPAPFR